MQEESQQTEQSQSNDHYAYTTPSVTHIEIDTKLLRVKESLLAEYYRLTNDTDRLNIIHKWPCVNES